ncbi:YciI family protein [Pseudomonas sp. NPDC089743]|uniref:YciI family protein n=1 Tax=Pseudomonas sp. NPDC089743 TaxID=3364471 RepID=UPI003829E798
MQFAIIAYDFDDALERRIQSRDDHVERLKALAVQGQLVSAGALLDNAGKMIGSNVHLTFETRASLDQWLASEPYMENRVWEDVQVREIKLLSI